MDIVDKLVVVTGAGSGIGRALAHQFAAEGARLVVCADLDGDAAQKTASAIGSNSRAVALDVASREAIHDLVMSLEDEQGGIDIFASNAGYAQGGGLALAPEAWQQMMEVHTWSHLYAAQAVIPLMIARGGGYLLNTSSAAGLLTQMDSGPYAVSKHASVALAEWLAINYKDRGIGVSVLCPQAVRTAILSKRRDKDDNQREDKRGAQKSAGNGSSNQAAVDGILEPEDVATLCMQAVRDEQFLILPHPEVARYFQNKANDYDRWLNGMRRMRERLRNK
jgi:NAD(P)-dependent dehydrogenase (short-subunit alcohol dehydrogenase family)